MTVVLEYLVIAAVIGAVVFLITAFVFGRGEQMAPLPPRTSPAELPGDRIGGDDVRHLRFSLGLRGYRMSDVDWALDRLAQELDRLHHRVAGLGGEPLPAGAGPAPDSPDELFPIESGPTRESEPNPNPEAESHPAPNPDPDSEPNPDPEAEPDPTILTSRQASDG